MANENNEEYQDEGEYHFSDDQANYTVEAEMSPTSSAVAVSPKEKFIEKIKEHRRLITGLILFFVLMIIVYKLITPTQTNPTATTDFTAAPAKIPAKTMTSTVVQSPAPVTTTVSVPSAPLQPPVIAPAPTVQDRLIALEQQNSQIMNALQSEYAQRMSSYEAQNKDVEDKLEKLNARITNIETALTQLIPVVQGLNKSAQAATTTSPKRTTAETKVPYTVEAIIPGRAWLKTEAGDTVTVAEGDVVKGLGRVRRINPYDGVVEIDTGKRTVTLSYGFSGD